MKKELFVAEDSIVREIWGKSDTILFIFAGASAEFALNKAVDWLYFTGRLPKDPLGRLFSTVDYARQIVFSDKETALRAIENMNRIHASVGQQRGSHIPQWAYRDVLFMLIDYSIKAYELLERPLEISEKKEVFKVFWEVGLRMGIQELPVNFEHYQTSRSLHLQQHLLCGEFTDDLYRQYRKHLGWTRYRMLLETQIIILPEIVRKQLGLRKFSILSLFLFAYKFSRNFHLDEFLKAVILPSDYKKEIRALDRISTH
ncbi:MAG: hypothetical protein CME35_09440 [Gramella sp.]|nr:hypothetical protein [Christiangramia sp.]